MRLKRILILLTMATHAWAQPAARSLVERLGFPAGTRLVVINADDAGLLHSANVATVEALRAGLVGSATVMTPSPWFPELATLAGNTKFDFGVHLTFTSEWEGFRFGPVLGASAVPSLVDKSGYLHADVAAFHAHATPADAEAEGAAQIQRALDAGLDVSHLDMHMHALGLDARFFDAYLHLAERFDLPVRFIPPSEDVRRDQANRLRRAGIVFQDQIIVGADLEPGESLQAYWRRKLHAIAPGVTELYVHLSLDAAELRAMTGERPFRTGWRDRVEEHRIFTSDVELRRILDAEGVKLVRWMDLRELQRRERADARQRPESPGRVPAKPL